MVLLFGFLIFISIGFGVVYFWQETRGELIGAILFITLALSYIIPPLLNCHRMNLCKYAFGAIILLFLAPMYIHIFIIYIKVVIIIKVIVIVEAAEPTAAVGVFSGFGRGVLFFGHTRQI